MNKIYISGYLGDINIKFVNGDIDGPFYDIKMLSEDFLAVKKEKTSSWTIMDKFGNENNTVLDVDSFNDGFFKIQLFMNNKFVYLDLIGRITDIPTESGKDFYKYFKRKISYRDLNKEYFDDSKFRHMIIIEELKREIERNPIKYEKGSERAQKQLEIHDEIIDWLYHNNIETKI